MMYGIAFVIILELLKFCSGLNNGLALTPPMGWNSWLPFGCNYDADDISAIGDAMVANGLLDAGYTFVNLDDCWMNCGNRDANGTCNSPQDGRDLFGRLVADKKRFPQGLDGLADTIHKKGLLLGVYLSSGQYTCTNDMGSGPDNFANDAQTLAGWGVDYVKLACCNSTEQDRINAYGNFSNDLNQTARPIVFSCDTSELFTNVNQAKSTGEKPYEWAPTTCNLWRTGTDISADWDTIINNANENNKWLFGEAMATYAAPGQWNDPDVLLVGSPLLNTTQHLTQFMLWSLMASPLIIGVDVRNLTSEAVAILTAPEILAVNQDSNGVQGSLVAHDGFGQIWLKTLSDGSKVTVLYNPGGGGARDVCVTWNTLGWPDNTLLAARDMWQQLDLGNFRTDYCQKALPDDGAAMIKFTPAS